MPELTLIFPLFELKLFLLRLSDFLSLSISLCRDVLRELSIEDFFEPSLRPPSLERSLVGIRLDVYGSKIEPDSSEPPNLISLLSSVRILVRLC